jgi:hypothetical protein
MDAWRNPGQEDSNFLMALRRLGDRPLHRPRDDDERDMVPLEFRRCSGSRQSWTAAG